MSVVTPPPIRANIDGTAEKNGSKGAAYLRLIYAENPMHESKGGCVLSTCTSPQTEAYDASPSQRRISARLSSDMKALKDPLNRLRARTSIPQLIRILVS